MESMQGILNLMRRAPNGYCGALGIVDDRACGQWKNRESVMHRGQVTNTPIVEDQYIIYK